jgi:hypothetical protein
VSNRCEGDGCVAKIRKLLAPSARFLNAASTGGCSCSCRSGLRREGCISDTFNPERCECSRAGRGKTRGFGSCQGTKSIQLSIFLCEDWKLPGHVFWFRLATWGRFAPHLTLSRVAISPPWFQGRELSLSVVYVRICDT